MSIEKNNQFDNFAQLDIKPQESSEQAWPMNNQDEKIFLDDLEAKEIDLICNQLNTFAKLSPGTAVKGYRNLIEKYPDHPKKAEWEACMVELSNEK
jgi:hypothetical protein